ncbi:YhgE/Pip family protein [Adlercreutzia sp. ZJ141]|uniref:YhgE/Pip family protein n=1 Tax=Adlercreutzia sp. ZJ141 TaxID=2709406 RepID=UPI0013EDE8E6|nr:YhgE/Pip domain-containing protein [Adlercreutzia sp. ZJ141]
MSFRGLRFATIEWKNITAAKVMWVVIGAIAIMPLLYGALYLAAFQDPYARLNTVPVAVVNEDKGAVIAAEHRNLGEDVIDELKNNDDGLQWNFVSAEEASKGLENGDYFMTCTIPADFSESVASVDGEAPRRAQLKVKYNESENMLASQIGETVWKEVRMRVSDTIAEEYWITVLSRVADSGKDIQIAADGAGELRDGLVTAQDGSTTITANLGTLSRGADELDVGLGVLVRGAATLQRGTSSLTAGADQLRVGNAALATGTEKLSAGSAQVVGGANDVASGVSTLQAEGTSVLAQGVRQLTEATSSLPGPDQAAAAVAGSESITSGIQNLQGAADSLNAGAGSLVEGAGTLEAGANGVSLLLTAAEAALENGDVATAQAYLQQAHGALGGISAGASSLKTGAVQLQAGIGAATDTSPQTLYGGLNNLSVGYANLSGQLMPLIQQAPALRVVIEQIDAGAKEVDGNMAALVTGASQVATGAMQVSSGATELTVGAQSAANGATTLSEGVGQLNVGVSQLTDGTLSAKDGSLRIANGATQLEEGSATLTDGLASAVDGSGELQDGLADGARTASDQTTNIDGKAYAMSNPVELANEYYTNVKNYGTGFAPYFMALGLWVGGLVAGFVFKPLNNRLILSGSNPITVAFANYLPVAFFSLIQATLLMVVLQFGLQLQIDNVAAFYAMGYLTALVFAAIMQVLMAAFGFPGKFIAIILLMLQLTACAGTFPIQTTPDFFQIINPFMPMTYVVEGMRQIMTGFDYGLAGFDCVVLACIGVSCFVLTCLVAWKKRTVTMNDLHPVLQLG